jgi:hypothetical protein
MDSIVNLLIDIVVTWAHEETVEQQCVSSTSKSVPNGLMYTQVPFRLEHQNIRRHIYIMWILKKIRVSCCKPILIHLDQLIKMQNLQMKNITCAFLIVKLLYCANQPWPDIVLSESSTKIQVKARQEKIEKQQIKYLNTSRESAS